MKAVLMILMLVSVLLAGYLDSTFYIDANTKLYSGGYVGTFCRDSITLTDTNHYLHIIWHAKDTLPPKKDGMTSVQFPFLNISLGTKTVYSSIPGTGNSRDMDCIGLRTGYAGAKTMGGYCFYKKGIYTAKLAVVLGYSIVDKIGKTHVVLTRDTVGRDSITVIVPYGVPISIENVFISRPINLPINNSTYDVLGRKVSGLNTGIYLTKGKRIIIYK